MIILPAAITEMPEGSDKEYMESLYQQYNSLMYYIAWQYSKDRMTVDDIVSEAAVALVEKVRTLRELERSKLSTYIVNTVRNTAANYFDKQHRRNSHLVHVDVSVIRSVPDEQNIEEKIVLDEELDLVWAAINSLPEKEMMIMKMKFLMNLPDRVIADAVGLSASSIPKYVSRAREHIKKIIYD